MNTKQSMRFVLSTLRCEKDTWVGVIAVFFTGLAHVLINGDVKSDGACALGKRLLSAKIDFLGCWRCLSVFTAAGFLDAFWKGIIY